MCLIGLVLFSITGFTLNHASSIGAKSQVSSSRATLPPALLTNLQRSASSGGNDRSPPSEVSEWIRDKFDSSVAGAPSEWSEDDVYISLPRPGGDAWMSIDLVTGEVTHEVTRRGWISYLNDLHKGRNTGTAWSLFIDLFALATLIFAITGLLLLKMHSNRRPATWPAVGFGLVLPLILALLFIH
jgi:uncharacterized protein